MHVDTPGEQAAEIHRLALALAERAQAIEPEKLVLVGSKEAAEMLGLTKYGINTLRRRGQLPEPVAELACGPIWRAEDLEVGPRDHDPEGSMKENETTEERHRRWARERRQDNALVVLAIAFLVVAFGTDYGSPDLRVISVLVAAGIAKFVWF